MASDPALCVCGLAAEAGIARRAGFAAIVGGGNAERTASRLAAAMSGARCLISFGIAGGLDPDLRPGRLVLSGEVVAEDGQWRADDALHGRIAAWSRELSAATGKVLGGRQIIATAEDKARAWAETGAVAVDLESAITARAASAAGIPFLVLRAIADGAPRDLPAAALIPLGCDGKPAIGRVLASLATRPHQLPSLIDLARATRAALAALTVGAAILHRLLERG